MRKSATKNQHTATLDDVLALARRVGGRRLAAVAKGDARLRAALVRRLSKFAAQVESADLDRSVVDLVNLYSAARQYCDAVDRLTGAGRHAPRDAASLLVRIQVLLYQEVMASLVHVRRSLAGAIASLRSARRDRVSRGRPSGTARRGGSAPGSDG